MHVFSIALPQTHAHSLARRYASDLGKAFGCPIFHVNADDVEAVNRVFELAGERVIKVDIYIERERCLAFRGASCFQLPTCDDYFLI